jgi:hypothetical protein
MMHHQEENYPAFDLTGLKTYDLESRPSKVFVEDLGRPVSPDATLGDWLESLPNQLAGKWIKRAATVLATAAEAKTTVVAAIGGHVIKTGCAPYLIRLMEEGVVGALAMNGAAAIHDYELALGGKTSEDVGAALLAGRFGMAREVADAYSIAAKNGAIDQRGLGRALGDLLHEHFIRLSFVVGRALAHHLLHLIVAVRLVFELAHLPLEAVGLRLLVNFAQRVHCGTEKATLHV